MSASTHSPFDSHRPAARFTEPTTLWSPDFEDGTDSDYRGLMNSAHMQAWRTFLEAHANVVKALENELRAEADLPLTWYDALIQLKEAGGSLRMHELADRLLLSRSATTRFADRLEAAGLIGRQPCDADRRGTRVYLTDQGLATLRAAAPIHLRGIEEHFARHLSAGDAAALTRILGRVLAAKTGAVGAQAAGD